MSSTLATVLAGLRASASGHLGHARAGAPCRRRRPLPLDAWSGCAEACPLQRGKGDVSRVLGTATPFRVLGSRPSRVDRVRSGRSRCSGPRAIWIPVAFGMRRLLPDLGYRCGGAVAAGFSSSVYEADQLCSDGLDVGGTGVDFEVIRQVAVHETWDHRSSCRRTRPKGMARLKSLSAADRLELLRGSPQPVRVGLRRVCRPRVQLSGNGFRHLRVRLECFFRETVDGCLVDQQRSVDPGRIAASRPTRLGSGARLVPSPPAFR
jgi:hypothetical protein